MDRKKLIIWVYGVMKILMIIVKYTPRQQELTILCTGNWKVILRILYTFYGIVVDVNILLVI